MNAIMENPNFIFALMMGNKRPQQQRFTGAIQAAQGQPNNPVSLILLKNQFDAIEKVEGERDALKEEVKRLTLKDPDQPGNNGDSKPPPPTNGSVGHLRKCRQDLLDARADVLNTNKKALDLHSKLFECQTKLSKATDDLDRCTSKATDRVRRIKDIFDDFQPPQARLSDAHNDDVKTAINKGVETYTASVIESVNELHSDVMDCIKP